MLKLSVLLLVGSWLSCPRDFLHQKSTQLLSFSEIWHRREMETAFQRCTLLLLKLLHQRIVTLCNKMWKPTLFNFKKGWVSHLLRFLAFLKSLFADQQPVLFTAFFSNAFFYRFTGIINYRFLTNQIVRTISVILLNAIYTVCCRQSGCQ